MRLGQQSIESLNSRPSCFSPVYVCCEWTCGTGQPWPGRVGSKAPGQAWATLGWAGLHWKWVRH